MKASLVITAIADLIWPPRCAACSTRLHSEGPADKPTVFCRACSESLLFVEDPICPLCGLPYEGSGPNHRCSACLEKSPPFLKARAVLHYGGAAAEAILRFKYGKAPHLGRPLGRLLALAAGDVQRPDLVAPIPLHPKRLRDRGFNQSTLLARPVAAAVKASFHPELLKRVRDTGSQTGLSRAERTNNLKGAFSVSNAAKVSGSRVLLIDDVVTTTTTVREAALTLTRAGARSIEVLSLARASGSLAPFRQKS
ncbi:MAG: ComF family protein [Deltaproteobacteria bacterium]|nr:ComF family protein [Deltaproteobacteria bacterium]